MIAVTVATSDQAYLEHDEGTHSWNGSVLLPLTTAEQDRHLSYVGRLRRGPGLRTSNRIWSRAWSGSSRASRAIALR